METIFGDFRRLFGAKEVESKLKGLRLRMDSLFTGIDCPHAAVQQISAACQRRKFGTYLALSLCAILKVVLLVVGQGLTSLVSREMFDLQNQFHRYGFELHIRPGRACENDGRARKFPSKIFFGGV